MSLRITSYNVCYTKLLRLIGRLKKLFSPIVTGVTIMLIGFSLANVAVQYSFNYFADPAGGSILISALVAALTFITTILVSLQAKGTLKAMPIIIGAVVGYIRNNFV